MVKSTKEGWINWKTCNAKRILLQDLRNGILPLEDSQLAAQDAWDTIYKDRTEFMNVCFEQFKVRLRDHRAQVKANPTGNAKKRKNGTKSLKAGWIDWANSEARNVIIEDLIQGILPMDNKVMTERSAWDLLYKNMAEFSGTCFEQFKLRLRDHRIQVNKGLDRAKYKEKCMEYDRTLFPRKKIDDKGVLIFDLHPAKLLLREDVAEKRHKHMTPLQLWKSREEYQQFEQNYFWQRIYQTAQRQKFVNWLEQKRAEKKLDACNVKRRLDPIKAKILQTERQQDNSNKRQRIIV